MVAFTFILMIIGILATYTQVFALETAKIFAQQTGVAASMITWHNAAVSLATNVIDSTSLTNNGCKLIVPQTSQTMPGNCQKSTAGPTISGSNPVLLTNKYTYTPATPLGSPQRTLPYLPTTYSASYNWYSIAYKEVDGTDYVVTFSPPGTLGPSNPTGLITTASKTIIGLTASDLMQQLRNTRLSLLSYGTVINAGGVATLSPPAYTPYTGVSGSGWTGAPVQIKYTLPKTIPSGAIAIVTPYKSCPGC